MYQLKVRCDRTGSRVMILAVVVPKCISLQSLGYKVTKLSEKPTVEQSHYICGTQDRQTILIHLNYVIKNKKIIIIIIKFPSIIPTMVLLNQS